MKPLKASGCVPKLEQDDVTSRHVSFSGDVGFRKSLRGVYQTRRWKNLRKQILDKEPLCRLCSARGLSVAAYAIDHIIRHSGLEDPLAFDTENLQPLCVSCHSKKTLAEDRARSFSLNERVIQKMHHRRG